MYVKSVLKKKRTLVGVRDYIDPIGSEPLPRIRDYSDPDWIQTNDLLLRRQLLYSTELPGLFKSGKDSPIKVKWKGIFGCIAITAFP